MEQRRVAAVGQGGEQLALEVGRCLEHAERLCRVRRDDDRVVGRRGAAAVGDLDAVGELADRGHLGVEAYVVEAGGHRGDVGPGSAGHRAPLGRPEDAEHAVVLEEGEEVARGVVERGGGVARPHGRDQRLHEVAHEAGCEAALVEELAQRLVGAVVVGRQDCSGTTVEARDLQQHPPVGARRQRGPLGEEPARAQRTGVLHTGAGVADRQRHLAGLGRDAELGEEPQERRVGATVVHDEAGVDRQLTVVGRDAVRVGVPTEAGVGLVERDVGRARRDVRRSESGHAGADDGDPSWGAHGHVAWVRSNRAIGSDVGSVDPPSGSTVMPTAAASAAAPSRTRVWSLSSVISPAGVKTPSGDMSQSS